MEARSSERSAAFANIRRRFAKSTCPVRTHHVSFVLNNLRRSQLRHMLSFATYCAPTVHQNYPAPSVAQTAGAGSCNALLYVLSESPETCATVHEQGLTGNEPSCIAGKKRDCGSDLTRMRESPHGHSAQIPGLAFAALRIVRAKQLCFSRAWRNGIRGNAVGCELYCHGACDAFQRCLCCRVA